MPSRAMSSQAFRIMIKFYWNDKLITGHTLLLITECKGYVISHWYSHPNKLEKINEPKNSLLCTHRTSDSTDVK